MKSFCFDPENISVNLVVVDGDIFHPMQKPNEWETNTTPEDCYLWKHFGECTSTVAKQAAKATFERDALPEWSLISDKSFLVVGSNFILQLCLDIVLFWHL